MTAIEAPALARRRISVREWFANPWGKPRFLAITTWLYIAGSLLPVRLASSCGLGRC